MRTVFLVPLLALSVAWTGCQRTAGDAAPPASATSTTPPSTEAPSPASAKPAKAPAPALEREPSGCVAACVQARQMEAVGIEEIEATCKQRCAKDPKAYP